MSLTVGISGICYIECKTLSSILLVLENLIDPLLFAMVSIIVVDVYWCIKCMHFIDYHV